MRNRISPIIALAAVTAFLFAGCGRSSDSSNTPSNGTVAFDLASASAATAKAGSAKLALDMKMSGDALQGHTLDFSGDGTFDLRSHRGEMTLDMGSLASMAPASAGLDSSDLKVDEIIDGVTLYMRAPFLTKRLSTSATWLKLDLKSIGQDVGVDMTSLMSGSSGIDPSRYLDQLKATSGSIERKGTETVRGTPTTRYHAVVDYDKLPDTLPAAQRAAARKSIENIEKLAGIKEAPVDVWVDGRHRVRRVAFTLDMKPTSGALVGKSQHMEMTMDLYDFGAPVDIKLPSPGETQDLPGALGAPSGSLSSP